MAPPMTLREGDEPTSTPSKKPSVLPCYIAPLLKMRPKLGQHFLRDPLVVRSILEAAELHPTDDVLEIGPGKGILTETLITRVKKLIAVELDRSLAAQLEERFGKNPAWTLVP